MHLKRLQQEVKIWTDYNFGSRDVHPPHRALLGIIEEIGELYHADKDDEIADGIGDVMIYMADYCNGMNFDLDKIAEVHRPDTKVEAWKTWLGIIGKLCHE